MAKNDFQYGRWNYYTMQCGTITTLISPGDCTLQCGIWLWNRDSEFTEWQHPAMWHSSGIMALNSHERPPYWNSTFYFDHITAVDMSCCMHQSAKFYPNRTTLAENMTSCRFSRWRISAIWDFRRPIMGSLKSLRTTSCMQVVNTAKLLNRLQAVINTAACYGRPLSVSGRPCYILPMFFF